MTSPVWLLLMLHLSPSYRTYGYISLPVCVCLEQDNPHGRSNQLLYELRCQAHTTAESKCKNCKSTKMTHGRCEGDCSTRDAENGILQHPSPPRGGAARMREHPQATATPHRASACARSSQAFSVRASSRGSVPHPSPLTAVHVLMLWLPPLRE